MKDREKTVIRILLFVAKILADVELRREIESLSAHIAVSMKD